MIRMGGANLSHARDMDKAPSILVSDVSYAARRALSNAIKYESHPGLSTHDSMTGGARRYVTCVRVQVQLYSCTIE